MTRLTDLSPDRAQRLAELDPIPKPGLGWSGPALQRRRVAIVSSAGLVVRGEYPFRGRDPDYRAIPSTVAAVISCAATSDPFDRTSYKRTGTFVFPIDRRRRAQFSSLPRPSIIRSWARPSPVPDRGFMRINRPPRLKGRCSRYSSSRLTTILRAR